MDQQKIGGFIAAVRRERGLTQRELAERLHITNKAVSKWELGRSLPDCATLEPLAHALGVTVDELLCGERRPQQAPAPRPQPSPVALYQNYAQGYARGAGVERRRILGRCCCPCPRPSSWPARWSSAGRTTPRWGKSRPIQKKVLDKAVSLWYSV